MKIKKYTIYILILILFVGISVPIFGVHASVPNPYEPCIYNSRASPLPINNPCGQTRANANVTPADACAALTGISKVICQLHRILNIAIPFIITLGLVYFIWGVVQYFI